LRLSQLLRAVLRRSGRWLAGSDERGGGVLVNAVNRGAAGDNAKATPAADWR